MVLGLAGLLASTSIRSVSTGAAAIGVVSLAAVLASPHLDLTADSASVTGQMGPVTPWAGTFILPLTLALLTSAVIAAEGLLRPPSRVQRQGPESRDSDRVRAVQSEIVEQGDGLCVPADIA